MSEIEFVDDVTVEMQQFMGGDHMVAQAAWVSTGGGTDQHDGAKIRGLINYLMKSRHGSPFEHGALTYFVEAPIFVFREFHRHRIASYNEVSGRYSTLKPRFYVPKPDRKLVNVGTSARPEFAPGTPNQVRNVGETLTLSYEEAWSSYTYLLELGVANEVARTVLPVGIMSQMYVTMNPRALMNFLSLRVDSPDSAVRSRPQWEIQLVAEKMESLFSRIWPITHETFVANGRVAP